MEGFPQSAECALGGVFLVYKGTPGKESPNVQNPP